MMGTTSTGSSSPDVGTTSSASAPTSAHCSTGVGSITRLCRAANRIRGHVESSVLADAAMNWTAYDVLQVICDHQQVETYVVAETVGIAKGTLTYVVNNLTTRGLVRRRRHHDDQRRMILEGTEAGQLLARGLKARVTAVEVRMLLKAGERVGPLGDVLRRFVDPPSPQRS
jgi:DNA-binding MarR family transcriptional regulator